MMAPAPRTINSGSTATSGHVAITPAPSPVTSTPEADDGADRHRPELEALVAAVPADAARPARLLLGEPSGEERSPAAAPRTSPAQTAPQHRRQRRPGRRSSRGRARRHDRTLRREHARLPRCVVASRGCCSSSPPSALALAAGGWYLQRVAFDTARSGDLARVVLRDEAIRTQIASTAAIATASTLGVPVEQVQAQVDGYARTTEGAELMRQIVTDAHARLIGERDEPVQITAAQLVQLTRNEQVGGLPPIVLDVERVGALDTIRRTLDWAVPIAAITGGAALLLGLIAHPRKADAVFGIGMFCIVAGIATVVLGYVVPVHVLPLLSDDLWTPVHPRRRRVRPAGRDRRLRRALRRRCRPHGRRRRRPAPQAVVGAGGHPPLRRPAPLELISRSARRRTRRRRRRSGWPRPRCASPRSATARRGPAGAARPG